MSDSEELADRALLARWSGGDETAFDEIFRSWYGRLVRLAIRIVGDHATAEDVVQVVMWELWRRRESPTVATSLPAYLYTATRNRALNSLRGSPRRQVDLGAVPDLEAPPADADAQRTELEHALWRAVALLPPRCHEIFVLSRVEGLRYADIAQRLGVSVKTVETQMGRALRALRGHLAPLLTENSQASAV